MKKYFSWFFYFVLGVVVAVGFQSLPKSEAPSPGELYGNNVTDWPPEAVTEFAYPYPGGGYEMRPLKKGEKVPLGTLKCGDALAKSDARPALSELCYEGEAVYRLRERYDAAHSVAGKAP